MNKDIRRLLRALEDDGYTWRLSSNGHPIVYAPTGERVTTLPGTPSDHRSMKNALAPLKRRGFQWPPQG